jgi:hypothetical protein
MQYNLPPGIAIIQSIITKLDAVHLFIKKGTSQNLLIRSVLKESSIIDQDQRFLEDANFIMYMQMLMLAGMSMFGGVSVSCLNGFLDKDNQVVLRWDNGISDRFEWGQYTPDFVRFISYYQDRLSSKPQNKKHIPADIFFGIRGFLSTYTDMLSMLDTKIMQLISGKRSFLNSVSSDLNKDALFLVISSLPTSQLSRFFMTMNPLFPEELSVKTPDGRTMKLRSLFESPSSDYLYLSDKLNVFLDIYFKETFSSLQTTLKSKTVEFLNQVIQNDLEFKEVQGTIKSVKQSQIDVRKTLYSTLKTHLDSLVAVL